MILRRFGILPVSFLLAALSAAFFFYANALSTEETSSKIKTIKFFIFQEPAVLVTPSSTTTAYSIFIGEQSPIIKDAYIEIRGVSKPTASQTITADVRATSGATCTEAFGTPRSRSFTLDTTGQGNHFTILYTGTGTSSVSSLLYCLANIITSPGSYPFELKVDISGADVSALQARMVITYQFTPPAVQTGGFVATGNIISSTFDTYAVNGAAFNSIIWKGTKPPPGNTTKVRLQFAASNCSNGASNPPACTTGSWNYIGGGTCSQSDYYEPNSDAAMELKCFSDFNNMRYFRYKVILCSNTTCTPPGGSGTPQVDDVIVNWSP